MNRTTKNFSVTLPLPLADAVERTSSSDNISAGSKIAEIVEWYFIKEKPTELTDDARIDLLLLRELRDEAIEKMLTIEKNEEFSADITLKTFQACQNDTDWLKRYEKYIRGNAVVPGNPRKTNANQTIGSRIKSKLRADDLLDISGKPLRGRAPAGSIIQTYQLLRKK